jgi:hypothetical protein
MNFLLVVFTQGFIINFYLEKKSENEFRFSSIKPGGDETAAPLAIGLWEFPNEGDISSILFSLGEPGRWSSVTTSNIRQQLIACPGLVGPLFIFFKKGNVFFSISLSP